jgi:hypothetical protein
MLLRELALELRGELLHFLAEVPHILQTHFDEFSPSVQQASCEDYPLGHFLAPLVAGIQKGQSFGHGGIFEDRQFGSHSWQL